MSEGNLLTSLKIYFVLPIPRRVSGQEPTSPGARFEPHINQSRPNAKDEEDLQLQMALRMSKEQADKEEELL